MANVAAYNVNFSRLMKRSVFLMGCQVAMGLAGGERRHPRMNAEEGAGCRRLVGRELLPRKGLAGRNCVGGRVRKRHPRQADRVNVASSQQRVWHVSEQHRKQDGIRFAAKNSRNPKQKLR